MSRGVRKGYVGVRALSACPRFTLPVGEIDVKIGAQLRLH
jgi:hypothetical protein